MSDRTKYEVTTDIQYAIQLHFLHCRLYKRARYALTFISLAAGMTAFAFVFEPNGNAGAIGAMGVLVATCSIIDATANFSTKAMLHKQWRSELIELLARSDVMDAAELDTARRLLGRHMEHDIGSLEIPAYNDNLRRLGHDAEMLKPLSWFQRLMRALA